VVPSIADGNHVSARSKRLTVGGTWEHMQFREGREWTGGVRVAYRIYSPLSFTVFVMGPSSEIRGGIRLSPKKNPVPVLQAFVLAKHLAGIESSVEPKRSKGIHQN